jgi:hypothetical protein
VQQQERDGHVGRADEDFACNSPKM